MEQYIKKSALVAEIKRRINEINIDSIEDWRYRLQLEHDIEVMKNILSFIDTMEVKDEVASIDPLKAMQEALRTEYEKGRADVLRCIDPDVMVADFCSQPLSKTRSIASIYRQGIIDIVKRINNNEKTSITGTRSIDNGGV